LETLDSNDVRPTSDRVKEAIFSILGGYLEGLTVLDLFSGSGNLGIESISRGALKAYFVDKSNNSLKTINQNIKKAGFLEFSKVVKSDAISFIKKKLYNDVKFDIIFLDPPYNDSVLNFVLNEIGKSDILKEKGFIIVEKDINHNLDKIYGNICEFKIKKYGKTNIVLYKNKC
jgi:16S rRNA (guanine(966)-N(2))-methyltransferase RsmD